MKVEYAVKGQKGKGVARPTFIAYFDRLANHGLAIANGHYM